MRPRTCVITGGSRGIGLAIAMRLARHGDNVVLAARDELSLYAAAEQVKSAGGTCEALRVDVSQPADCRRLIDAAVQRFGAVDVLVNNAGVAPLAPVESLSAAAFEQLYAVNIAAVFHTTQAVWPVMKRGGGGVIVNISSMSSVDPFPGFAAYGASKAWVNLFTRAVAAEGKPYDIRAYAVAPAAVETRLMRTTFPAFPADQTLAPDDVAAVVESVCDARMRCTTGETIFVRK